MQRVTLILHLSDLHLLGEPREQDAILASLITALEKERARRGRRVDLIAITGDVFDSATIDPRVAVRELEALHKCITRALGDDVPTIVVPGNHDRRRIGLFGPHDESLFRAVREALGARMLIHGCDTPFLAKVVPPAFHAQPLWAIAYDSTYLPHGWLSAGGVVRHEDLLHAAAQIGDAEPDWPLLFLLHHHLVPTPLTDVGPIETHRMHPALCWMLHRVLPVLVAHADREELTMTALGAGTALSTLHDLRRAVLVLHGHKHYATARKLDATEARQGDVLLVSAGSAGTAQRWSPTSPRDTARLWPSFNVIELEGDAITIEAVSFGWKGRSAGETAYRPLVWASREGAKWRLHPIEGAEPHSGPKLIANESRVRLMNARRFGARRWDYECERRVEPNGRGPRRYVETIEGARGALLEPLDRAAPVRATPAQLELGLGALTRYRVDGGVCRSLDEATRVRGAASSPFEWIGLMNRYRARRSRLVLEGLGAHANSAFASTTDLATGQETPLRCHRDVGGDRVVLELDDCPARTLLRVYWPLEA
ncbi:hypothetical protein DB32_002584 [Sandaracinus amylolyticus]|uniref:Calcineurin-like phosphoesterase domain-containing protein n=1 Tax=Sandaracinus amylolyticus TaxID=927083 RepID=A0A0F6YHS8_9BACT|nr:hypothetical protein DB32_002584 [Sandaracinus amylolyticus]